MVLKKLFLHLQSTRFLQYTIIGSSAFILDYGSLFLFKEVFNLNPVWAVIVNQPPIILYVFLLNKYWSFNAQGNTINQAIKFLLLMLWNYLFAIVWMWFWTKLVDTSFYIAIGNEQKDFGYMIIRFINIILAVSWNFLLYKYWIYSTKTQKAQKHQNTLSEALEN